MIRRAQYETLLEQAHQEAHTRAARRARFHAFLRVMLALLVCLAAMATGYILAGCTADRDDRICNAWVTGPCSDDSTVTARELAPATVEFINSERERREP